jgi:hypothetical protein
LFSQREPNTAEIRSNGLRQHARIALQQWNSDLYEIRLASPRPIAMIGPWRETKRSEGDFIRVIPGRANGS